MREAAIRLARRVVALRRPSGPARQAVLVVAVVAFAVFTFLSWREFPREEADDPRWAVLVAVGILGPSVTIWLNAVEFKLQAGLLDQVVTTRRALRISVLSTAANLLPLPGAVLVRGQALVASGARLSEVARVTGATGMVWLAVGFVTGAAGLMASDQMLAGAGAAVVGSAVLVIGVWMLWRLVGPRRGSRPVLAVVAVEVALTAVAAVRFVVVLIALGLDVTLVQGLAVTVTGALSNAAGIFPAGLGLREALTAGVGVLVDLPAAAGYAAAATDRIMGLIILSLASLGLLRWGRDDTSVPAPASRADADPAR